MSLIAYVDLETFEVSNEPTGFIECDYEIAKTIALLNKKGYKTRYSCAGHNKNGFLQRTVKEPIEIYDEWLKKYGEDKTVHVIGFDEKYFYHKDDETETYTYILFEEDYNFHDIPEVFEKVPFESGIMIGKFCKFFIDEKNGIRRNDFDIEKEIDENQNKLYEWALSLEYINKKER